MTALPISANITEVGGAYYQVRLASVPRVGDLVRLDSFVDIASKHPHAHRYEVVQVLHELSDVTDTRPSGHHFVTVFVRPSQSSFFGN